MSEDALYQERILALAKAGRALPRLEDPDATARVDNPICGDRVTVDFKVADNRVEAVGAKVQGCALCQAATAVIADNAIGQPLSSLEAVATSLQAYLIEESPDVAWPDLEVFSPVRPMKSRRSVWLCPSRRR